MFLSFFLLLAGWTCAEAAYGNYGDGGNGGNGSNGNSRSNGSKKDDLRDLPPLDSFQLTQVGDANLMITITGRKLPRPDVVHEGSQTIVTLTGVRWEDKDREHRVRSTPMVTDLTIRQAERDVVVSISTEKPLQLQSTNGTAPANVYTLRLTTVDQHIKMIEEPIVTQQPQTLKVPQGPFAVNTPITLDLRDTELRDVFRLLGLHLKKNIIIDPSLPPALVTMTVRNVPLSEA
ncbi:MAG: hypothetical protein LBQ90_12360, partial [Synergistaceae bacterium]|nr:hypothetical protein [Synergistaceae bacterium]